MKIVLDTNVLFAALRARKGVCAQLFELCLSRHTIITSDHILGELRRHLAAKNQLTPAQIDAVIATIMSPVTRIVVPSPVENEACRDLDDLAVLGAAIAAEADMIVSGDSDLLVLKNFRGVLILSPREFLDRFANPLGNQEQAR